MYIIEIKARYIQDGEKGKLKKDDRAKDNNNEMTRSGENRLSNRLSETV